jgi:hypothetical protein
MKRSSISPRRTRALVALAVTGALAAILASAGTAGAAIVTIGNTATNGTPGAIGGPATIFNTKPGAPAEAYAAPIGGTVIRWRATGLVGGPFFLQTMNQLAPNTYSIAGTSSPGTPAGTGTETFTIALPIKAGQSIAVKNSNASDKIGIIGSAGSFAFFNPALSDGQAGAATESKAPQEFTYSAEIQPLPTVSAISPAGGSTAGGTSVTITGTDLTGAKSVTFGGTPATALTVNSETSVTATAPAHGAGAVPVVVTTLAGSATAATQFTYTTPPTPPTPAATCTVPKLRGTTLKAAKRRIRGADCNVGKLTKRKGATAKNGEVVQQVPKPGVTVPANTQVKVTLAP